MRTQFLAFYQAADRAITSLDCRGRILCTAVALAAARLASLPAAPVDGPSTHYNFAVLPQAQTLIAEFNEQIEFDVRCALAAPLALPVFLRLREKSVIGSETFKLRPSMDPITEERLASEPRADLEGNAMRFLMRSARGATGR